MSNARDQLQMVNEKQLDIECFTVVDRLQNMKPGTQVAVVTTLFLLLVQEYGLCTREVLETTDRIMADVDKHDKPQIRALRQYIQKEVLHG